jgi:CRISPR-associated protein Cas5h
MTQSASTAESDADERFMPNECIVLDIAGEFAHFRKPSTTSPAQTFGLPPRTTIAGMLAGMLGLERDSYYELFSRESSRIAVSLERPIRRLSIPINILTTEGTKASGARPGRHITNHRQQTVFETLCDPAYRLYVALADETMMDRMEELFGAGKSVYTLSLGLSEHLATFDYVGRFPVRLEEGRSELRSAVPGEQVDLIPASDAQYVTEQSPAFMRMAEEDRVADGSQTLLYDRNGGPIEVRNRPYAIVGNDDRVAFSG